MKRIFYFILLYSFVSNSYSQNWEKQFGIYACEGYAGLQLPDTSYISVGAYMDTLNAKYDVWILKLNKYGDTLWSKTYGGIRDDYAQMIKPTSDSCFVIVGTTYSFGAGCTGVTNCSQNVYVLKINQQGDTLWTSGIGNLQAEGGVDIIESDGGGFLISGYRVEATFPSKSNVFVSKIDSVGNELWSKIYYNNYWGQAKSIARIDDSSYVVLSTLIMGSNNQICLIKIKLNGDTIFTKIYGSSGSDGAGKVIITPDNNLLFTSSFSPGGNVLPGFLIYKTNLLGDTLWTKKYNGGANFYNGGYVNTTKDGDYVITGSDFIDSIVVACLLKIDNNGNLIWRVAIDSSGFNSHGSTVQQTTDGGYFVVGSLFSDSYGWKSMNIKVDSMGCLIGNCLMLVTSINANELHDSNFNLFPNPAQSVLNYTIEKEPNSFVHIEITDILGIVILSENTSLNSISIDSLTSGIYFLSVKTQSGAVAKVKFIKE